MTVIDAIFDMESKVTQAQDKVQKIRRIANYAFNGLLKFQCVNATQEYQIEKINLAVDLLLDYAIAANEEAAKLQTLVEAAFEEIVKKGGDEECVFRTSFET